MAVFVRRRLSAGGAQPRDLGGDPATGGKQEVPGANGGVDHLERQQRCDRVLGVVGEPLLDDRYQGRCDELLHQAVGGVVAAGELAGVAAVAGAGPVVAGEAEVPGRARRDPGGQLQQGLVDRAQLLGVHVAVVDATDTAAEAEVGQAAHGGEQSAVLDVGAIQVRALSGREQPAEGRQAENGLAAGQCPPGDLEPLPEIMVAIGALGVQRALAQAREAVAGAVESAGIGIGGRVVQTAAFLRGGEEDQPVDQPQQLLEQRIRAQLAGGDAFAQHAVGGMGDKAGAERPQGLFDTVAQRTEGAYAFFGALAAPSLQRAVGGIVRSATESRTVQQQPEHLEAWVESLAKQALQVDLDEGRAGQAGVVAHQPEQPAIADQAPERGGVGIQVLLQQPEGRAAPAVRAKAGVGTVEREIVRRQHQRHAAIPAAGPAHGAERKGAIAELDRLRVFQVGEAEHVAQQRAQQALLGHRRVEVRAGGDDLEVLPQGLGDAPVAAQLIAQSQPLGHLVVDGGLALGLQAGDLAEVLPVQQPALDLDRGEVRRALSAAGHCRGTST